MAQMGVLDTSAVIAFLRNEEPMANVVEELIQQGRGTVTSISIFELYLAPKGEHQRLVTLLSEFRVLPLDRAAGRRAADIEHVLRQRGEPIGTRDTLIAGIALTHGLPLYTQDTRHFERVPKLQVLGPAAFS